MEGLVAIGLLAVLYWLQLAMFPGPTRVVTRVLRWLWRKAVHLGWSAPVRRFGVGMTLWMWTVAGAAAVTVASCTQANNQVSTAGRVAGVLEIWALVLVGWLGLRWWARRRFRPRDLPRRRR